MAFSFEFSCSFSNLESSFIPKLVLFVNLSVKNPILCQESGFLATNKLKYKPTITSSIPNYISKADAYFDKSDLRVQSAKSVTY